jgi:phospholipase/lecithinase/hemolysin
MMNSAWYRSLIIAWYAFIASALTAELHAMDRFAAIAVFGDSLSDSGNAGRASDGPVWVEYLARSLRIPLTPSTMGGTNFATGGALTHGPGYSLRAQADDFLRSRQLTGLDARTLYVIWGGANDLRTAVGTDDSGRAVVEAVAAIRSIVEDLLRAGAVDIVVANLPALGRAPEWRNRMAAAAEATLLAHRFNAALERELHELQSRYPARIRLVDVLGIFEKVVANPGRGGFSNATEPCRTATEACRDPAGYVFWDDIHPTTAAHAALARITLERIDQSP